MKKDDNILDVSVDNGKYRIIMDSNGLRVLRHGEEWRDCVGDNLIYWLAADLQEARDTIRHMYDVKDKITMCNCMTKTPEPKLHAKNCPVYMADKIKRLETELLGDDDLMDIVDRLVKYALKEEDK